MRDIVIYKDCYKKDWVVAAEYRMKDGWFKYKVEHAPIQHGKFDDMLKWALAHYADREITIIPRVLYPL